MVLNRYEDLNYLEGARHKSGPSKAQEGLFELPSSR